MNTRFVVHLNSQTKSAIRRRYNEAVLEERMTPEEAEKARKLAVSSPIVYDGSNLVWKMLPRESQ